MYVTLKSSTCYEHQHAHLQEDKLYYQSIWYRHSLYSTVQYVRWEQTAFCSHPAYCRAVCSEWRYQMLWYYNLASWRWAC